MIKITHLSNAIGCDKGGGIGTVVRDYLSCNKGPTIKEQLWFPGSNNLIINNLIIINQCNNNNDPYY